MLLSQKKIHIIIKLRITLQCYFPLLEYFISISQLRMRNKHSQFIQERLQGNRFQNRSIRIQKISTEKLNQHLLRCIRKCKDLIEFHVSFKRYPIFLFRQSTQNFLTNSLIFSNVQSKESCLTEKYLNQQHPNTCRLKNKGKFS